MKSVCDRYLSTFESDNVMHHVVFIVYNVLSEFQ